MTKLLDSYSKHEDFIKSYWQTRLPEVDDLSAMYLGLAEEVGEYQAEIEKETIDYEEVKSEMSDILFYMTGILIELHKKDYKLTFEDIMNRDNLGISSEAAMYELPKNVFKMLSMYNKSIRKRKPMDEEILSNVMYAAYNCIANVTESSLSDILDYNVEKLSGRDVSGQNGTVAQ